MSLSEATGDKMIQGPVTEWTECLRPWGIMVCLWGAVCVYLGEESVSATGVGLWGG